MTSYSDITYNYTIDIVNANLVPTFKCAYPCATCPSAQQKDTCLSCFKTLVSVPEKYLNGTKCLAQCPAGTKANENMICLGIKTSVLEITSYEANHQPAYYSFKIHPTAAQIASDTKIYVTLPVEIKVATGETNVVCGSHVYIPPW